MKKDIFKKLLSYLLVLAMVLTSGMLWPTGSVSAAKKIKLSKTSVKVATGASVTLKVKNVPKGAKIRWSVKNKKIAKVTKKGKITGCKVGSTKVTAKVEYKKKGIKKTKSLTAKIKVVGKTRVFPSPTFYTLASAPATTAAVSGTTASANPSVSANVAASGQPSGAPAPIASGQTTETPEQTMGTPMPTEKPKAPDIPAAEQTAWPVYTAYAKWNDVSNIGPEREVTIKGASEMSPDGKMMIKDNGVMRQNVSSQDLIANEMGLGINLGNTLEATKAIGEIDKYTEATDFEQAWGAPVTTQEYIDAVHSYGFNTLRLPIAWSSMVSKDGKYTISEKTLGRVEEVVNYALNNGMYVIINDHYDYGWWGAFGSADATVAAEAWKRYEAYWTQISERFKDYSDHLIFESANEELDISIPNGGLNAPINENGYNVSEENGGVRGVLTEDQAYEMANKINQKFVDIVRESGGNNTYRHLLIAGYTTNIEQTLDERWSMPTDTVESNGKTKLMVSVHYYDPWEFCGDGMTGASYKATNKKHTNEQFELMKKGFVDQGYGVIVGEMGVCNPRQDKVTKWLKDTIQASYDRGCIPVLWDTPGTYFDRKRCIMQYKDVAELYNELTGANGNTDIEAKTGKPVAKITVIDPKTLPAEPVWSWTGKWKKNDGSNTALDGSHVDDEDVSKFIQMASCTDESCITFNVWGYQTNLKLDWSQYKNPCLYFTFEHNTEDDKEDADEVGPLHLGTRPDMETDSTDEATFEYKVWGDQALTVPPTMLKTLTDNKPYLYITFGNSPIITGIYVYDLGE